ncbi:MAG: efflux RND transporter periplasmic adaptor subunit [Hyphomicrobiaceae bacterium]|nr:efflux RND transporter periplasmic adaptor subunit [Hyphomicrobiaceae bacterium]
MRRFLTTFVFLAIVGGGYAVYEFEPTVKARVDSFLAKSERKRRVSKRPPAPVATTAAVRRDVPIVIEGVGNVQAQSTVEIKSRIDGQLFEAAVKEGQQVKRGDLLFRLDARPLVAQLRQAEANLARDRANLAKARADVSRYTRLAEKGISPKTKLEDAQASLATLAAAIRASQAAIEFAKLNLEYATIKAPIDGRVGNILITPGNMVKANDTRAMLVITQVSPINVVVALPERYIAELRQLMAAGNAPDVEAKIQGDSRPTAVGRMFFINNVVDTTTGTIQVMGRFENKDERLVPGQFVKAQVRMRVLEGAVVVPSKSVQLNQSGHYVWVVKADNTVENRVVKIGPIIGDETVIAEGVQPGDIVVTDGQLRLFPNAKVAPIKPGNGKRGKVQS